MYPKLEWWESKTPWYSRKGKNRDKGITGFNHEQISSDKNPTENIVETAVSTDNEIEKIVLENHELNSTAITHKWFAENSYQQEEFQLPSIHSYPNQLPINQEDDFLRNMIYNPEFLSQKIALTLS